MRKTHHSLRFPNTYLIGNPNSSLIIILAHTEYLMDTVVA